MPVDTQEGAMESFEIAVGQVWADADPRSAGRRFEITEVEPNRVRGKIVSVERNVSSKMIGRRTRWISKTRMADHNRGYRLVSNPATGTAVAS